MIGPQKRSFPTNRSLIVQRFVPAYAQLTPEEIVPLLEILDKEGQKKRLARIGIGNVGEACEYIILDVPALGRISEDDPVTVFFIDFEHQQEASNGTVLVRRGVDYGALMFATEPIEWFPGRQFARLKAAYALWILTDPPKYMENQIRFLSMPKQEELLTNVAEAGPDMGSKQSEEDQKVEEKRRKYMNPEGSAGLINGAHLFGRCNQDQRSSASDAGYVVCKHGSGRAHPEAEE